MTPNHMERSAMFASVGRMRVYFVPLVLVAAVVTAGCRRGSSTEPAGGTKGPSAAADQRVKARAAAFVDQMVPTEMVAESAYMVSVRMRNTGTAMWTAPENYRLGSANPLDNDVWGLHRVAVPVAVAPGAEVAFAFALRAPRTPGEYNVQWRMVQDGVEWFGEETPNVLVTVGQQISKNAK